jgi:galactose mutarotase-like enzyme
MSSELEVRTLSSSGISVEVVPALGGKIVSLKRVGGREWMWQPGAERKLFRNAPSDAFEKSTLTGWDECLPTIAPCTWKGRALPDHGEVWARPWTVAHRDDQSLTMAIDLPVSPFRFTRTLRVEGSSLTASYTLENRGAADEAYLWAVHPLFRIEEGDRIELPASTRKLLGEPAWLKTLDLSSVPARCAKLFASPLEEGRAAAVNDRTGERLAITWDVRENDVLGLWLTRGGWHGHHHLALEPANGFPDSLADHQKCAVLKAGATRSWSVTFTITRT